MKKLRLFSGILLLLTSVFTISCTDEAEPLDPAVTDPIITDCAMPTHVAVSDTINTTTVNISWLAGSTETSWEIEYGPAGFIMGEGTKLATDLTFQQITGIDATIDYAFFVRAICSDESASDWVGPLPINSSAVGCINPTNVVVTPSDASPYAINVNWVAAGNPTYWRIQYGPRGFTFGTGAIVSSTDTFKHIGGLQQGTTYDVYIIASCFTEAGDVWAGPYEVTTNLDHVADYWPMAIANMWAYKNNGTIAEPMTITETETINSVTYFKHTNFFGETADTGVQEFVHTRKNGNDYFVRFATTMEGPPAVTISGVDLLVLKDNLAVDETWSQTLSQTITVDEEAPQVIETLVTGKILQKRITMTVGGKFYNHVIQSEILMESEGNTERILIWYAESVGPIKVLVEGIDGNMASELDSYLIN